MRMLMGFRPCASRMYWAAAWITSCRERYTVDDGLVPATTRQVVASFHMTRSRKTVSVL